MRSLLRMKRVWIPLAAFGLVVVVFVVLAVVGRFSSVPEAERVEVAPSSSEASDGEVSGADDPDKDENPVIVPLPETDQPQKLAPAVAQVLASEDTAKFEESDYISTLSAVSPEIPAIGGDQAYSSTEWAEQIQQAAWSSDPWGDRAKLKTTDVYTPSKTSAVSSDAFLDSFAPKDGENSDEVRSWLTDHGLTVMEVEGSLARQLTGDDGDRRQVDMGTVTWQIALLCPDEDDETDSCQVFLGYPTGSEGGEV